MNHLSYNRVGSKKSSSSCHGIKGFRLNSRRFSVQRLRSKFLFLVKLFNKWRNSYGNALQSLKRNLSRSRSCKKDHSNTSRRNLVVMKEVQYNYNMDHHDCSRIRSFARTNSFYTEAIADCLDFIKRNSLSSMDENPVLNQR